MVNGSQHQTSSARQQQILDAALYCFLEQGIDATTIADVRARSSASTGSIYHHFRDKDGLVSGVLQRIVDRYQASLQTALPEMNTPKALIMGIVFHFTEWAAQHNSSAKLLSELQGSSRLPQSNGRADLQKDTLLNPALVDIEKAADDGNIIKLAAPLYEAVILGPVFAVNDHWSPENPHAPLEAELLAKCAWQALSAKNSGGKDNDKDGKDGKDRKERKDRSGKKSKKKK